MRILPAQLLAGASLAMTSPAIASDWIVDTEHSKVEFQISAYGTPASGAFDSFSADIHLNPEDLSTARISANVETGGASISNGQYESAMRGSSGLDVAGHRDAMFVSERVEGDQTGYIAFGTLTLKGVDQPAQLAFTLDIDGDRAVADGTLTIVRDDYGIGASSWSSVAANVEVLVHIEADRAP